MRFEPRSSGPQGLLSWNPSRARTLLFFFAEDVSYSKENVEKIVSEENVETKEDSEQTDQKIIKEEKIPAEKETE